MRDRELFAWLSVAALVVTCAALGASLALWGPKDRVQTVIKPLREQITFTGWLDYLHRQPKMEHGYGFHTSVGVADCQAYPPLFDGRTMILECTLRKPVAPFTGAIS